MSDFRFANLNWSHALWLVVALVALLLWLDWRRGDLLARFLSLTMQSRLVHRLSRTRRWLSIGCLGLAGASLVVALMRPQWGLTYHEMPRVGAQIMVCLDVSKSMLAEDTAPNRLDRAKAEVTDLLSYLEGDQVGLIAFAGRASVLCPLTPDFGFFKLIMDSAGPHSVGRGGTRLEEPIRKALDGFRTESDVSRIIVLITDGEDHDSHPLDAASAAAERGVRILSIGFGDEAGSEINVTDPETGVRSVVRDADGNPVISRLDGETLRDIALATEGAYIPAGTGALDLKSIHEAHIAPLVRGMLDDRGRAIRREGYQWAVLCGLLLLVASVVIGSGSVKSELRIAPEARFSQKTGFLKTANVLSVLPLVLALIATPASHAQQNSASEDAQPEVTANGVEKTPSADAAPADTRPSDLEPTDPRDTYNEALASLDSDFARAERLLTEARREAGTDGEVRFRSTYNMGCLEAKQADTVVAENPEEALARLRRAADWFRDAVRLRPDHQDARHNLEVVLRRILELADSLAKTGQRDLTQQLDALIEAQRGLVAASRQVVQRVTAEEDPNAADQFRSDFRQLAVQQRKILSDSQAMSNAGREEVDALNGKKDEETTPQDKLRVGQLSNLLHYANRANQRMGQARSQMRRRQAERAFRRAAAALTELKRSRDQLRGPVEILDVIIADALSLAQLTALKAAVTGAPLGPESQLPEPPAWLTREYLDESQLSVTERTAELVARLQAGLDDQESRPAGPPTTDEQEQTAQADSFLAMVRDAMPFLNNGQAAFESASQAVAADEFDRASQQQFTAIAALRDARERFLELRGLVELAYSREIQIQQLLSPPEDDAKEPGELQTDDDSQQQDETQQEVSDDRRIASVRLGRQLQEENLDRGKRIDKLIDEGLSALPEPSADGEAAADSQPADPAAQQAAAERQQLELAKQFLGVAKDEMVAAAQSLAGAARQDDPSDDLPDPSSELPGGDATIDEEAINESRKHVSQAVEHLQTLRRLFFSLIEHLRETAQRQAELNDETEQVAALGQDEEVTKEAGPLSLRQQELRAITQQIAKALDEQSKQQPTDAAIPQGVDAKQLQQLQQIAEQLAKAAKLVSDGGDDMQEAAKVLMAGKPEFDSARTSQDAALQKLAEALTLLNPPQPNQQNQANQPRQSENQQTEKNEEDQQQDAQNGVDPSRLLQAVRDREAQRRRERDRRQRSQQEPVEKDW